MFKILLIISIVIVCFSSNAQPTLEGAWIEKETSKKSGEYFEFYGDRKFDHVLLNGLVDIVSNGTYRIEENELVLKYSEQESKISKFNQSDNSEYLHFTITYRCEPQAGIRIEVPNVEIATTTTIDGTAILPIKSINKYDKLRITGLGMKPIELKVYEFKGFDSIQINMTSSLNSNYNWNKVVRFTDEKLILKRGEKKKYKRSLTPATQEQIEHFRKVISDDC